MFKRSGLVAFLILAAAGAGAARTGSLDENPDEVFSAVYERLGVKLPQRAARDAYVVGRQCAG